MHEEGSKRVTVAVRVRPILRSNFLSRLQQQERFELEAVHRLSDNQLQVAESKKDGNCRSSTFIFDYIFDQESTQLEVYEEGGVVDIVEAALIGHNATILAYGQTGSGKTFTVLGEVKPNPLEDELLTANSGLFLRVLSDLMEYKHKVAHKLHVVVGLSCVEIYNENIRDLLGGKPGDPPPSIRAVMTNEDVFLPSLILKEVTSLQSVFNEIQLAIARRQSRSTDSNATSSRSHCLFTIDIIQQATTAPPPPLSLLESQMRDGCSVSGGKDRLKNRSTASPSAGKSSSAGGVTSPRNDIGFQGTILTMPGQSEPVYVSKILLADLAGSEKIGKSGVTGEGLTEATSINSSLTALGNVVHSLYEGGFVSYRVSNLTRLLKTTFSQPLSRVLLLAQVSPTLLTFDETISTLHFANKVKAMKVTTTTGNSAEKLQFDVIEAQKINDAILADLHIFAAESQSMPNVMRRRLPQRYKKPYYDVNAKRQYRYKERAQYLDNEGIFRIAVEDKQAVADAKAEKLKTKQERFNAEAQNEAKSITNTYFDKSSELKKIMGDCLENIVTINQQLLTIDDSSRRLAIETTEELGRTKFTIAFYESIKAYNEQKSVKLQKKINKLNDEFAKSQGVVGGFNADLVKESEAANLLYANTTWFHCSGKRFFYALQEMREAQLTLLLTRTAILKVENWMMKVEQMKAELEKKKCKA